MKLSSNSLFHFTAKIDFLVNILDKGFWPRYCREYGWGNKYIDFAVPMVCFCDIPLSMIEEHTKFYGGYGIGVKRKWINQQKTITPVQYIAPSSHEFNSINRLLTKLKNHNINEAEARKLILAKKVSGEAINKSESVRPKIFYNEREWRHIPDNLENGDLLIPIDKKEKFDSNQYSQKTEDHKLTFDMESIQYLIIPDESKRTELIRRIEIIYKSKSREQKLILISKILSIKQILNDF